MLSCSSVLNCKDFEDPTVYSAWYHQKTQEECLYANPKVRSGCLGPQAALLKNSHDPLLDITDQKHFQKSLSVSIVHSSSQFNPQLWVKSELCKEDLYEHDPETPPSSLDQRSSDGLKINGKLFCGQMNQYLKLFLETLDSESVD